MGKISFRRGDICLVVSSGQEILVEVFIDREDTDNKAIAIRRIDNQDKAVIILGEEYGCLKKCLPPIS